MSYTLEVNTGIVRRNSDGVAVAPTSDMEGADYLGWIAWCDAGNSPVEVIAEPPVDLAVVEADMARAVQHILDSTANSRGYDSVLSAVSYANSVIPQFAADAAAFSLWRDQCWAYAYQVLADVQGGQRGIPTLDEFLAELPAFGG